VVDVAVQGLLQTEYKLCHVLYPLRSSRGLCRRRTAGFEFDKLLQNFSGPLHVKCYMSRVIMAWYATEPASPSLSLLCARHESAVQDYSMSWLRLIAHSLPAAGIRSENWH
jgi:hypothetical protein